MRIRGCTRPSSCGCLQWQHERVACVTYACMVLIHYTHSWCQERGNRSHGCSGVLPGARRERTSPPRGCGAAGLRLAWKVGLGLWTWSSSSDSLGCVSREAGSPTLRQLQRVQGSLHQDPQALRSEVRFSPLPSAFPGKPGQLRRRPWDPAASRPRTHPKPQAQRLRPRKAPGPAAPFGARPALVLVAQLLSADSRASSAPGPAASRHLLSPSTCK